MLPGAIVRTMTMNSALIIRPTWADKLTAGEDPKTWEIRGSNTKKRGLVGFIKSGASEVMGSAELIDSFPLTKELYEANMEKHQTEFWGDVAGRYKTPWVWVFENGTRLETPVPVERKKGQVAWAKIDMGIKSQSRYR